MSALAVVLAAGSGVADAARLAKNTVGSPQIKNGAVKAVDLKDGAVTGTKVLDGALTGADVADGALTGVDIDDTTLANALVAAGPASAPGTLTAAGAKVASATFSAPSAGFALVLVSAEFSAQATGTVIGVQLKEGASSIGALRDWDPGDVDTLFDQTQNATYVVPVAAGVHTYDLRLDETAPPGGFSGYSAAQVVVLFTARGSVS